MAYTQVIEGRYIDRKKLVLFLRKTFGERGYRVRMQLDCWILMVPQLLTEDQIVSCEM